MKTIPVFRIHSFIVAVTLSVSLGFVSPAFAMTSVIVNPDGKVTYLDTRVQGDLYRHRLDINDSGQVVGRSGTTEHAVITGPNGMGVTDLGTLGGSSSTPQGINNSGQVVGWSDTTGDDIYSSHAFITGPNGIGMTDLGTLGWTDSYALGINDSGQVVGYSRTEDGSVRAFITGPNGMGMTDLGTLGELSTAAYGVYSVASSINDSGQVVGYSGIIGHSTLRSYHAFITGSGGMGMTDLGTLGGYASYALGINDSGQVVGYSRTAAGSYHAFITGLNGMGMTDLGTLGGSSSEGYDINDSGQVVGVSRTADGSFRAFITGPDGMGMTDLNSFADLPDGHYLSEAEGINNLGQVLAVMSPIPEPASYALMLAGLGLVGFIARRKGVGGKSGWLSLNPQIARRMRL